MTELDEVREELRDFVTKLTKGLVPYEGCFRPAQGTLNAQDRFWVKHLHFMAKIRKSPTSLFSYVLPSFTLVDNIYVSLLLS